MKGFYFKKNGQSLEKVTQNSGTLDLLASGDGTEILLQEIAADKIIQIAPPAEAGVMEFFFVMSGRLELKNEDGSVEILESGDYFYALNIQGKIYLKTMVTTKLLYVSSTPIFHYISNQIKHLMDMVKSVEEKDFYTHSHGQRVQKYARAIADRLGFKGQQLENILYASLFHDIGKVRMSDDIIASTRMPTSEEWDLIKQHPLDGKEIVEGTFLHAIGEIIAQHHERLDGKGYPSGIMGDGICMESRIIGVVDAYDAMTTNRTYRKALSPREAVNELEANKHSQFDPQVVDIFIDLLQKEGVVTPTPEDHTNG